MPVIKSAIKKLRQDKKREKTNSVLEHNLKNTIKKARKNPTEKLLREVFSLADKASKNHLIHKNKAARIKSSLAKLLSSGRTKKPKKTTTKKISS